MHWLQSVEATDDGNFLGTFLGLEKEVHKAYVGLYSEPNQAVGTRRKTVSARLDLTTYVYVSPRTFFPALTIEEAGSCRHSVFQFWSDGLSILVPAVSFMKAFMSASYRHQLILKPHGLDEFGFLDDEGTPYAFETGSGCQSSPSARDHAVLQYLRAYPSATAFWRSVYTNLREGSIDVSLPKASMEVDARGHLRNTHFCVESLHIHNATALEDAFPRYRHLPPVIHFSDPRGARDPRNLTCADILSAANPPSESSRKSDPQQTGSRKNSSDVKPYVRRRRPHIRPAARIQGDTPFASFDSERLSHLLHADILLTNLEWEEVHKLLVAEGDDQLDLTTLRACVDCIIHSKATGIGSDSFLSPLDAKFVHKKYRTWRQSGVWTDVSRKLVQMRATLSA